MAAKVIPRKIHAVEVSAEVRQIKTMVDGSINLTLNLPEDCVEQAKVLLGWCNDEVKAVIVQNGETRREKETD